ncbi:hypothetical protein CFOL_v3_06410 [Cephalotus follicularis]|uniref:Uncharacterized protein n=1 Tax=Cephalotus follicularis TaxID=3775 RepID=A0A1Q3B4H5_CEPFO|nr:hypothetical protein CFOL_v3_06410 [Cephalotus follicularis]
MGEPFETEHSNYFKMSTLLKRKVATASKGAYILKRYVSTVSKDAFYQVEIAILVTISQSLSFSVSNLCLSRFVTYSVSDICLSRSQHQRTTPLLLLLSSPLSLSVD